MNLIRHRIYRLAVWPGPFDRRSACIGLREIRTDDKDILINGRPVNLRMTHFGGDFPLTGYPAMDVDVVEKNHSDAARITG